jgi:hypothetical protein
VNFQSDFSKSKAARGVGLDAELLDDHWIPVDLDPEPLGASEMPGPERPPASNDGGSGPKPAVDAGSDPASPAAIGCGAPLGAPVTTAQLHGWLERLRPSEPGLLSFERPQTIRESLVEPGPQRRIPGSDIVFVGRKAKVEERGPGGFDRARPEVAPPPSEEPGPADLRLAGSRRRKVLLGLALLVALTGAMQAVMRLSQAPVPAAVVDPLTL